MNPYYKDYAEYLSDRFPGIKVQKISVNAGFSCPNRDGTIGTGGCIYCDNTTFTPGYCFSSESVTQQLEAGKRFFFKKYPAMKYLAYFQSYSNTFIKSSSPGNVGNKTGLERLESLYSEALGVEDVVGLVIGSRPDCFPDDVVELLKRLNLRKPVFVELGAETSHDSTLKIINRRHSWQQTCDTVCRLAQAGISVGLHLIFGLPGETEEMMFSTIRRVVSLPIDSIKMHHLQVIQGTPLQSLLEDGSMNIDTFTLNGYLDLCEKIVGMVPRKIAIERFLATSPPDKVVAPKWGIKNYEFTNLLLKKLKNKTIKET
ncbi:MAG: TIGR01212 family radical SAM protein [Muribaculaceae bacterium]|nr:TIGR01212 family radical SAM protein [Muribaculaceae bacterium]